MRGRDFQARYGEWGFVVGASEGLGAAFARALAARGLNLILIARRPAPLEETAAEIRRAHDVSVVTRALDVSDANAFSNLLHEASQSHDIGVGVYNAAFAPIGDFVSTPLDDLHRVVDVNVRGPLTFAHTLAPSMLARGRGGLVLMSSLAGLQGSPRIAAYAASKAFNIVLGESLWGELRDGGVDVLASCAGAIRTPGYETSATGDAPGTLDPAAVAERTLSALGRGPRVVPGVINKLASLVVGRWLPRRTAVSIMAASTKDLG